MAFASPQVAILKASPVAFSLYWIVFCVVFFLAIAMALLDLRYIRMEYAMAKREIFRETLGDEEFRRSLKTTAHSESHHANGRRSAR